LIVSRQGLRRGRPFSIPTLLSIHLGENYRFVGRPNTASLDRVERDEANKAMFLLG
jgi:hypothetical protein